jgi:uncharacterized membrane protein YbhN (UPF0104 family)
VHLIGKLGKLIEASKSHPKIHQFTELTRSKRFRIVFNVIAGLVIIAFLIYGVYANWDELKQYEWTLDYRYLLLAGGLYGICFLSVMLGWHRVMASLGGMTSLRINARIFCYSSLPKRIPGVVWYIASRVHLYRQEGVSGSVTMLATGLETALLIASGLLVYLGSLLFRVSSRSAESLSPLVATLLLVPFLVLLHPAVFNRAIGFLLRKLRREVEVSLSGRQSAGLVLLYVPAWILGGLDLYLLANAIYPVALDHLPAVIGAWAATGVVGILASYLVQGLGVTEVTLAVLLSGFLPAPVAIAISIFFRILLTVGEVVWALLLAWFTSGLGGLRAALHIGDPPAISESEK